MSFRVTLLPSNIKFEVLEGQTLLSAATAQGVMLPHRCNNAVCMTCACKKVEGDVSYHLEPMLTEKEQQQGWILPCRAYANSHLILKLED